MHAAGACAPVRPGSGVLEQHAVLPACTRGVVHRTLLFQRGPLPHCLEQRCGRCWRVYACARTMRRAPEWLPVNLCPSSPHICYHLCSGRVWGQPVAGSTKWAAGGTGRSLRALEHSPQVTGQGEGGRSVLPSTCFLSAQHEAQPCSWPIFFPLSCPILALDVAPCGTPSTARWLSPLRRAQCTRGASATKECRQETTQGPETYVEAAFIRLFPPPTQPISRPTQSCACSLLQLTGQAQAGELLQLWSGALHPRDPSSAMTAGGHNIQLWDLRTMTMCVIRLRSSRLPSEWRAEGQGSEGVGEGLYPPNAPSPLPAHHLNLPPFPSCPLLLVRQDRPDNGGAPHAGPRRELCFRR
jgi:hypothetical protein